VTFPVEQLHLGQLVLGDHALDQFLRAGGSGDQEIDEPRVVQQTLGDSLFQEGIAGDGVLAAGLQNADQGHGAIFQLAAQALLEAARLDECICA